MTFNIFATKGVSCFGQYDRIDDLITFKLRRDKCRVFWQFLVDEFHFSAAFKCFDPLFVWHFRIFRRDQCMSPTLFFIKREMETDCDVDSSLAQLFADRELLRSLESGSHGSYPVPFH